MSHISLGRLFNLKTSFTPMAIGQYLLLALAATGLAAWLGRLTFWPALLAGALSAVIFFVSEWLHQLGHAAAARAVGYPMVGLHFHSILSAGLYPPDEPALPARLHIRRALGGFRVNVALGVLLAPLAWWLWPAGGLGAWLAAWAAVVNLLVLGLGAFVPLRLPDGGTTDGGTLLHYWRDVRARRSGR